MAILWNAASYSTTASTGRGCETWGGDAPTALCKKQATQHTPCKPPLQQPVAFLSRSSAAGVSCRQDGTVKSWRNWSPEGLAGLLSTPSAATGGRQLQARSLSACIWVYRRIAQPFSHSVRCALRTAVADAAFCRREAGLFFTMRDTGHLAGRLRSRPGYSRPVTDH